MSVRISISSAQKAAQFRKAGYLAELLRVSENDGKHLTIDEAEYQRIKRKFYEPITQSKFATITESGGSTDHERQGYVPSCCGNAGNLKMQG
jgi:hypothetical protein